MPGQSPSNLLKVRRAASELSGQWGTLRTVGFKGRRAASEETGQWRAASELSGQGEPQANSPDRGAASELSGKGGTLRTGGSRQRTLRTVGGTGQWGNGLLFQPGRRP